MAMLTITRGLPGSGKTTWAKGTGVTRVNRDDLRWMLHGKRTYTREAERQVTAAQRAAVEALLRAGVDVVVDDTNLPARYVREWIELAVRCSATVMVLDRFLVVPVEECVRRDAGRPDTDRVGESVIRDLHARYLAGQTLPLPVPDADPPPRRYTPPDGAPRAVLVDLDGTVCLRQGRDPYDETRVGEDAPNAPVLAAVYAMAAMGHRVIFMSGRSEGCRAETEKWLNENYQLLYEGLHMRAAGDGRRDAVVKAELFDTHVRDRYRVAAVFDDRRQVVQMWRAMGLTVFQVADGDF